MSAGRTIQQAKPVIERRPVVANTVQRSVGVSAARSLQQRLGNRATQNLISRSIAAKSQESSVPPVQNTTGTTVQLSRGTRLPAKVSRPSDPAELEAEETARKIIRMGQPATGTPPASPNLAKGQAQGTVQRAEASHSVAPTAGPSRAGLPGGSPLPSPVRTFMEPRFGANFGNVRIHNDQAAAQQSANLGANAFTVGEHVYFGQGKYQPQSESGRELIAHELTHTIQQGAATQGAVIQRSADVHVAQQVDTHVQRELFGIPNPREYFAREAENIPGFTMLTVVIGFNPISGAGVDRSPGNILKGAIQLIPGGKYITDALASHGIFDRVSNWVAAQFETLKGIGTSIRNAISNFISNLSITDGISSLWDRAKNLVMAPINQIKAFAGGLFDGIVTLIKEAILKPIAAFAKDTRGYPLLCVVMGRDPITNEPVARTPETLLGAFLKFVGEEETWNTMQKANAIPRAYSWFNTNLAILIGFVSQIPGLFIQALQALRIEDIILIPRAFLKLASVFGGFAAQFISWGANAVWKLLEIIFDVVSPGALVYIKKTGAALKSILRNPLPFVGNLVRAAKLGFENFAGNILTHLKTGLIEWLTGALPGVYIPKAFSLTEIAKFVFSVLGLTWANIRQKLVKAVGETTVKTMETGFDIVVTLVRDGPAAAWDKIKEQLSNLKDMVIGGITDFVVDSIVKKAVPKLISMFIPGAGFVSAILSIYETVMVFVNRIKTIVSVVTGFIDSIVSIAAGQIGAAATRVETALSGVLSLAINLLAGFAGLGNVASKVMGVINKIRAPIDKALDWLVGWIVKAGQKLFGAVKSGVKRLLNWFKKKVPVTGGGESHTLGFDGSEKNAKLVLRSTPQKPSLFLTDTARDKKVPNAKSAEPIKQTESQEIVIEKILTELAKVDDNEKKAASGKAADNADKLASDLDGKLITLAGHVGATLGKWNVSDAEVKEIKLPRSKFTVVQKTKIAEQHEDKSQLRKDSKGNLINVKKGLARRHVVSSKDMSSHYEGALKDKKVSAAKLLLEQRASIAEARVPVTDLSVKGIQEAATTRYSRFFGYLRNLFIGDSRENSRIQEHLDAGHPDLAGKALEDHVDHVKRAWGMDQSLKPSRLNEEAE